MRFCHLYPICHFSEDSGILKRPSDGEIVGHALSHGKKDSKKKAAAQAAFEKHLMDCKATDLQHLDGKATAYAEFCENKTLALMLYFVQNFLNG